MNPIFLVSKGMDVKSGDIIGYVGPKNVYGIKNNPYKDSSGNPTNRSHNRSSFAFWNKKRRHSRQPFRLFLISHIIIFKIFVFFMMMSAATAIMPASFFFTIPI